MGRDQQVQICLNCEFYIFNKVVMVTLYLQFLHPCVRRSCNHVIGHVQICLNGGVTTSNIWLPYIFCQNR